MALATYSQFVRNPSRRDIYLYNVTIKDDTRTTQTLRWSMGRFVSGHSESPPDTLWEPRVISGALDYQSPAFNPFSPQYGCLPSAAPSPLVIAQFDGDLDVLKSWYWPGSTVQVLHGGYTADGWLPLSAWRVVNTAEVDGWPKFDLDRVEIPLRSREARFRYPVERRKLGAFGWCIEGDGSAAGVDFYPLTPGIVLRSQETGNLRETSGVDVVVSMPPGIQSGDLLVVDIASHGQTTSGTYSNWDVLAVPSGWTLEIAGVANSGGIAAHRLLRYKRVADGTETETYTWTGTGTACARNWVSTAWHGQDGTTPILTSAETSPDTVDQTANAPSVTDNTRVGNVLLCGWSTQKGWEYPSPDGMQTIANLTRKTSHSNRSSLKVAYETLTGSGGATGVRTIQVAGSRHVGVSSIIQNRAAGGQPTKIDLRDALSLQFGMIPTASKGVPQQLLGWETTPFRVYLDSSMNLAISWKKSTATVTKTSSFTFVAGRRYHVEIAVFSNLVKFYIYDWRADSTTEEAFAGTTGEFHTRDAPGGTDHFTFLYNRNGGSPTDRFAGQLWSVRIWNAALSKAQLETSRNRRLTASEEYSSTLKLYVPFDEKGGTLARDRSGTPNDGTISQTITGPTTLSAVAAVPGSPAKFTRSAGSFSTDGWSAGRVFSSTGWTKSANNGRGVILSVAALTIEVLMDLDDETGGGDEKLVSDDWRPTLTGGEDKAGAQVPCLFGGPAEGWPGVEVEQGVDGTYFLVHPVKAQEVRAIQEGGGDRPISVEYEDYSLFLGALPEVGTYTVYRGDVGTFYRSRTAPSKPSTCTLLGDAFDGTFVETPANIVRRVLTTRGDEPLSDPGDLDTTSISTLNADAPYSIALGVGEGESIQEFCRKALGAVGAVVWAKRSGLFRFERFEGAGGSPTKSIDRHVFATSPRSLDVAMPVSEVTTKHRKNWLVLERSQIDANVKDPLDLAFLTEEWRKGTDRRWQIAAYYPRSRDLTVETYFCHPWLAWSYAKDERIRLLDLFGTPPEYLEVSIRQLDVPTEFLEQIFVTIEDLDKSNVPRIRLSADGVPYVCVGVADDHGSGFERLLLFRQDTVSV